MEGKAVSRSRFLKLSGAGISGAALLGTVGWDRPDRRAPELGVRSKGTIRIGGESFRDLNGNGKLDPYEDWRLPTEERVDDLLSQMTLEEKVGMMLIDTLNSEAGGGVSDTATRYIHTEKMSHFVFRNTVTEEPDPANSGGRGGAEVTPYEAARFMNGIQELAESTRLGIPALFKSNARNHYEYDPRAGINVAAGSFSEWPKEAGLAATRDMNLIAKFAEIMAEEWTSIGLRGMYGYMADLATEPRWYRVHETFTENAELAADIMKVLVENLQGRELNSGSVALTMKHFPGGGPQEGGADPHYEFGKNQVYPTDSFDYHVRPFKAAIDAGVAAIMPYYGIPVGQIYQPNDVGMAFSEGVLTGLLRSELGFEGYVNSDTGIIGERAWGLENESVEEQIAIAVEAGTDALSGFNSNEQVLELVTSGRLAEARVDDSVRRLLNEQFELGLFENPYVAPDGAGRLVGKRSFQIRAEYAQRKSIVLLQNNNGLLPLSKPNGNRPVKLYTMGMDPEVVRSSSRADRRGRGGKTNEHVIVSGDYNPDNGETRPTVPADTDYAVLRIAVTNEGADPDLNFGGANPDELDLLAFSDMATAESWSISPPLEDIKGVMYEAGAENTILSIYFRQPYVLDQLSGLKEAGAILATFGVRDEAIMDILTGQFEPAGKLPFALAENARAVVDQAPDAPGYDEEDTLFSFGHGLTYQRGL